MKLNLPNKAQIITSIGVIALIGGLIGGAIGYHIGSKSAETQATTPVVLEGTTPTEDATGIVRRWKVTRVIDGDTFEVETKFFPPELGQIKVRVDGIDTPEIRGKCEKEKALAQQAKQFATNLLVGNTVVITDVQADKYGGRVVAVVSIGGKRYTDLLISNNFAVPYNGGTKQSWC